MYALLRLEDEVKVYFTSVEIYISQSAELFCVKESQKVSFTRQVEKQLCEKFWKIILKN